MEYIEEPVNDRIVYEDFIQKPFYAFLVQSVHLSDSFNSCLRHFPRKPVKQDEYTKDSIHSMQEIASPILVSLMSNLELMQRSVFSCLFDLTCSIPGYSIDSLAKNLREIDVKLGIKVIVGYRGTKEAAGSIVASALTGWHNPEQVNRYFKILLNIHPFYSDEICKEIKLLWQLRHCIVHTGGTITVPDSQKIPDLVTQGGNAVVFRHQFVNAIVRRFHKLLSEVRNSFYPRVIGRFGEGYRDSTAERIDTLFFIDSPRKSFL